MPLRPILLEAVNGNGSSAGGKLTFNGTIGYEYERIQVEKTSGTLAVTDISAVEVLVNALPVMRLSGQELDEMNKYDGITAYATNSVITIPFGMRKVLDARLSESTNLNTGVESPATKGLIIDSVVVNIELGASAASANVAAYGLVDDRSAAGPGVIKYWRSLTKAAAAGENRYSDVLKGTDLKRMLARIFVKASAGTISAVRLEADGRRVWQSDLIVLQQNNSDGLHTNGSYWTAVADYRALGVGFGPDALPFLDLRPYEGQTVDIIITNSASGNNTLALETVGLPPLR